MTWLEALERKHAELKAGRVLCECGRFKDAPAGTSSLHLGLYDSNLIKHFSMEPSDPMHACDPLWLRAEVLRLRETVQSRTQKIREMGVGMQRLKDRLGR